MTRIVLKWAGIALAVLILLAGANHLAGFIPFTPQWSAKRAAAKADRLEGQVETLTLEREGNAQIGQAVESYHTREVVIRETAAAAIAEARNAPDANIPLAPERGAVLRGADDGVCRTAPAVCPAPDAP